MSVRKTIFEWGIWLLHTLATCRIYGITEESGTHAPWLFTSYDPWDEAARSCKYSASSMLWWTMFPNVPHLSQQTSKRHYHPLVYPSFIGFIMFYEYHHGGSWGLQQSNKSPPIRWPPRSWSVPFENETAMPQGQPAPTEEGHFGRPNWQPIWWISPTRWKRMFMVLYMLKFGCFKSYLVICGCFRRLNLVWNYWDSRRQQMIATTTHLWRRRSLTIVMNHSKLQSWTTWTVWLSNSLVSFDTPLESMYIYIYPSNKRRTTSILRNPTVTVSAVGSTVKPWLVTSTVREKNPKTSKNKSEMS